MTGHKPFIFRFVDFEVRESDPLLIRAGVAVPVEPKAFRVLIYLLQHAGRVVTKNEITAAVWDDCSVSDNSLARSIATLRRVMGDDSRAPRYIATVQTVGYRFLCNVDVEEDRPTIPETIGEVVPHPKEPVRQTGDPLSRLDGKTQTEGVASQVTHVRRMSKPWVMPALLSIFLMLGLFFAGHWIIAHRFQSAVVTRNGLGGSSSTEMRILPFTSSPGAVWGPAFSPDGNQIAYLWDGENPVRGDLYVKQVGGQQALRLTHTRSGLICCADWSPDGRELAFNRCGDDGGQVLLVSALGGPERELATAECSFWYTGRPIWTKDGRSLLLNDQCAPDSSPGIVVFSRDTGAKRCLDSPQSGDLGDGDHAMSPDQRTVAFIRSTARGITDIYTVPLLGGKARRITFDGRNITEIMWDADGQRILFNSNRSGLVRVWGVSAKGGPVEPEASYPGVGSLSPDGNRFAYVEPPPFLSWSSEIWRAELSGAGGQVASLKKIIDSEGGNGSPQLSLDQLHIAFSSARSGSGEIWKSNADGTEPLQLTSFDGYAGTPRWSPDGKWIAFDYGAKTHTQIYLMDAEGRNVHQVTTGDYENVVPSWSPDGSAIYFASNRTGDYNVWSLNIATGSVRQVTHQGGFAAFESYDSKTIYYSKFIGAGIWCVPIAGGGERQVIGAPHVGYWGHFAVTEEGIYVLDTDAFSSASVLFYSFQTRTLRPVLHLGEDPLPWHADLSASRDGRILLFAQGRHKSSITLVENFRPGS